MNTRIAKKILTQVSSLHKNKDKVYFAKCYLAAKGYGKFIRNKTSQAWGIDFILYSKKQRKHNFNQESKLRGNKLDTLIFDEWAKLDDSSNINSTHSTAT